MFHFYLFFFKSPQPLLKIAEIQVVVDDISKQMRASTHSGKLNSSKNEGTLSCFNHLKAFRRGGRESGGEGGEMKNGRQMKEAASEERCGGFKPRWKTLILFSDIPFLSPPFWFRLFVHSSTKKQQQTFRFNTSSKNTSSSSFFVFHRPPSHPLSLRLPLLFTSLSSCSHDNGDC